MPKGTDPEIELQGQLKILRQRVAELEKAEPAWDLARENAVMAEIGRIVSSTLKLEEVYERFAQEVKKLIPFDRIAVSLVDPAAQTGVVTYISGVEVEDRRVGAVFPLQGTVTEAVMESRSGLLFERDSPELQKRFAPLWCYTQAGLPSMLVVPLIYRDAVIGSLILRAKKTGAYREEDLRCAERISSQITGAIANAQLYLQRQKAEEALRESEERYRTLVTTSPDAILLANTEMKIIIANPQTWSLLGYQGEEMGLRKSLLDFLPAHEWPRATKDFQRVVLGLTRSNRAEYALKKKDGSAIRGEIRASAIRDLLGTVKAVIVTVRDITEREHAEERLLQEAERIKGLAARLAEAEETERQRLARELHDRVGQNLSALGINLNIVRQQIGESSPLAASRLNESLALVVQTTEQIRDLMTDLRPPVLEDYGLISALHWYAAQFSSRTSIPVAVQGGEFDPRPAPNVETALFRIVQEALTNIAKHARAAGAMVIAEDEGPIVRLVIADDGDGFDPSCLPKPDGSVGWGLMTMAERAEAVGGTCRVDSEPGRGTRVIVEVPH